MKFLKSGMEIKEGPHRSDLSNYLTTQSRLRCYISILCKLGKGLRNANMVSRIT